MRVRRTVNVIGLLLVLGLMGACMVASLLPPSRAAVGEVTDPARYEEIRQGYGDSGFVRHFPTTLPREATATQLYYRPRVMQGAEVFQLRVNVPSHTVNAIADEFRPRAVHTAREGELLVMPGNVSAPRLRVIGEYPDPVPLGYELLILASEAAGSADAPTNHGHTAGIAINVQSSEIVYWFEYW